MKVGTISNLRQLTNALLMLNLEKKRFIRYIVLKRLLEMALMNVKNFVYNKLAGQNIFCFINSILILVVLIYCNHHSYSCSSSSYYYSYYHYYWHYYHYYFYFIVIVLVLSISFILFYFILSIIVHITMTFVCNFFWHVCVPS